MKALMEKLEGVLELGGTKKEIWLLVISAVSLILSIIGIPGMPFDPAWIAVILCGVPIILEAVIGLVTAFDIKADVLVSIALTASVAIGEIFAAGEVAVIMQLGGLLEELTVARARAGIERLVHLTPRTARVVTDGHEKIIPAEEVALGDIIRVLPGETIPVDGILTKGRSSINQAVMTGESLPTDKEEGDELLSGTVNQFGTFEMKATKVGEDSSIQRMIRLVQSADAGKAKIVGLADRWATWIVVTALSAALITFLVTHEIIRSVTILVVFCPCAMVLATPTAIMAAIGNATKHGFLVREGDSLERLAGVGKIVFDKTGTLTYGIPKVTGVKSFSEEKDEKELLILAACVEQYSEHPLGRAVVRDYRMAGGTLREASDFQMLPGLGVMAKVDGEEIIAGNRRLIEDRCRVIPENMFEEAKSFILEGSTVIYMASDGRALGFLTLSDTLRKESADTISQLKSLGLTPVLLTGDGSGAACAIGQSVGIDEIRPDCLPEDKLSYIKEIQDGGGAVCMIGDGVNDAPALKTADVGIAMGGVGSDIAVDAADIALVDDKVGEIPHLFALSKRMMSTIKINLTFSLTLNFIAIILAITGVLGPVFGALVHNAGSVLVIINSSLLLQWKKESD